MSSDRDPRFSAADEPDEQFEDEEAPRSIFSAAWFRVVVVVLAVGVIGAIAVPYVLDVVNAPTSAPMPQTATAPTPTPSTPSATAPSVPSSSETATAPTAPATPPATAKSATPTEGGSAPASTPPAPVAKAEEKEKPKALEKAPAAAAAPKAASTPPAASAKKEAPAAERATTARAATPPARAQRSESGGDYFVQLGAFQDQATAKRLVSRLREQNYPVDESVTRGGGSTPSAAPRSTPRVAAASGPDRYDVIVSGGSTAEVNSKLSAKGLASEPAGDSVKIRPSLSLRDAVALSKDLGSEGFKVQVRRGAGGNGAPAAAEPAPSVAVGDGPTLYRVRVGPYPDRATALGIHKEFQEKGYQPFVARGRE
jgi:cell division septation protein DedD